MKRNVYFSVLGVVFAATASLPTQAATFKGKGNQGTKSTDGVTPGAVHGGPEGTTTKIPDGTMPSLDYLGADNTRLPDIGIEKTRPLIGEDVAKEVDRAITARIAAVKKNARGGENVGLNKDHMKHAYYILGALRTSPKGGKDVSVYLQNPASQKALVNYIASALRTAEANGTLRNNETQAVKRIVEFLREEKLTPDALNNIADVMNKYDLEPEVMEWATKHRQQLQAAIDDPKQSKNKAANQNLLNEHNRRMSAAAKRGSGDAEAVATGIASYGELHSAAIRESLEEMPFFKKLDDDMKKKAACCPQGGCRV